MTLIKRRNHRGFFESVGEITCGSDLQSLWFFRDFDGGFFAHLGSYKREIKFDNRWCNGDFKTILFGERKGDFAYIFEQSVRKCSRENSAGRVGFWGRVAHLPVQQLRSNKGQSKGEIREIYLGQSKDEESDLNKR